MPARPPPCLARLPASPALTLPPCSFPRVSCVGRPILFLDTRHQVGGSALRCHSVAATARPCRSRRATAAAAAAATTPSSPRIVDSPKTCRGTSGASPIASRHRAFTNQVAPPWLPCRALHSSRALRRPSGKGQNHYERLDVRYDASPGEIKKSFYALSKTHHPDANRGNPHAADTFALISESYTVLSDPGRRAAYDRDVLRRNPFSSSSSGAGSPRGSYHSTNPAGGRSPSGLSRRRTTFRGPPPSFYRSGGWGGHADKRQRAHDESTGGAQHASSSSSSSSSTSSSGTSSAGGASRGEYGPGPYGRHGGMGPGGDPFGHGGDVPHFDKEGHTRTHRREDERRWRRARRAMGDDDIEFEPQMSMGVHFLIVAGILGVSTLAPFLYLQLVPSSSKKREPGL